MSNRIILGSVYLILSGLIILNVCLYIFGKMSYAGYWSDRVIFWLWLLVTLLVVISFWKNIWTKIYFCLLVATLILTILPMAIPFFGLLLAGSGSGRLNHFSLENNMRVQTVGYGIMGRPRLQIVKDGLLFDKIVLEDGDEIEKNDSTWLEIRRAKNAKLIGETDTSITVKYFFEKDTINALHIFKYKKGFNY